MLPLCVAMKVLIIDYSIWFEELQKLKALQLTAATGQNAALQLFFWWLVHLLSLLVVSIFIFEGPKRPDFKQGKHVLKLAHWMHNAAQYLIEAFGFEHSTVRCICFAFSSFIDWLSHPCRLQVRLRQNLLP
jgi:hypothetical protein